MKRSPLQRFTPLRRTGRWKRRRPIKRISAKKFAWYRLYILGLRFLISLDPLCRRCRRRRATEGHHPWGQIGAMILLFWPFCRPCHNDVENNKNQARVDGWILYPIRLR